MVKDMAALARRLHDLYVAGRLPDGPPLPFTRLPNGIIPMTAEHRRSLLRTPAEGSAKGSALESFLKKEDGGPIFGGNQTSDNATMSTIGTSGAGAVAAATSSIGGNGGDPVANTTTAASISSAAAGKSGKKKNKKKSTSKATPPAEPASGVGAEKAPTTTTEKWDEIWRLLKSSPEMTSNTANYEHFKAMLGRAITMTAPDRSQGPVCGNPSCGKFGHTIAVCPTLTCPINGDISGCFFCNVVDHDADDCTMMEWASPATLVTFLITNRAGMPPWRSRVDWVELAIQEWDLVCFTMLPLTRKYVRKVYIPGKRWEEIDGVSHITDPLFENASRKTLKALAKKAKDGNPFLNGGLMESSREMCYCRNKGHDGSPHAIFNNERLDKYIPNLTVDKDEFLAAITAHEREIAASEMQLTKQMPKTVTKERKGRRAMKKEAAAAAAAAAAQETIAGPSQEKTKTTAKKDEVKHDESSSDDEPEVSLSDKMLDLTDAISEVLENLQNIVKS